MVTIFLIAVLRQLIVVIRNSLLTVGPADIGKDSICPFIVIYREMWVIKFMHGYTEME